jgi:sarcosine oxidase subunit delta
VSDFQIGCPNCGRRAAAEFSFGGEAIAFPAGGIETLEENYERVWLRENAQGRQTEQWFHFGGCRCWVSIDRNTVTNVS